MWVAILNWDEVVVLAVSFTSLVSVGQGRVFFRKGGVDSWEVLPCPASP